MVLLCLFTKKQLFQSTLSARRATHICNTLHKMFIYFNPRSPRGERRHRVKTPNRKARISIHALREESDGLRS